MSFSQEAKDFVGAFKTSGSFINDYQRNKAIADYYKELAAKAKRSDPIAGAFDEGHSSLDGINTDMSSGTTNRVVDYPNGRPGSQEFADQEARITGGGTSGSIPSVDNVDSSLDSAGALPEATDAISSAVPELNDALMSPGPEMESMAGLYSSGGVVKRLRAYFSGGMVADDEPDQAAPAPVAEEAPEAPTEGAIPSGGAEDTPEVRIPEAGAPEGGATKGNDPLLGMALHGSTMFLQDMFSMRDTQPQGALPVEPGAAHPEGGRFMFAGLGAASKEDYDSVMKVVDPHNKLDDNIRNIAGIKSVYDYYLKRGDVDKANKAASSLIQYTRNVSAEFGGQALEAYRRGDFKGAADLVEKGYNQIPDGNKLDVTMAKNGSGFVIQKDEDGNIINQGPFSPEHLLQAATGMKNGGAFWKQIMSSAQRQLGNEPSAAYAESMQRLYGIDANGQFGKDAYKDAMPPEDGEDAQAVPTGEPGPAGGPFSDSTGVTPVGNPGPSNPAPTGAQGMPPKPIRPVIEQPDPKLLTKMQQKERAEVIRATDTKNRTAIATYNAKLKDWEKTVGEYKAQASRRVLDSASSENYGMNPDGTPKETAIPEQPTPRGVDTGEKFGPAVSATDQNPMGVIDDDPEAPAPRPTAPQYRRYSNDPALSEADRRSNRAEVNQINSRLKSEYDKQVGEYGKGQTASSKATAKAGGPAVKAEKRSDVEGNIASALDQYQGENSKTDMPVKLNTQENRKVRSAAYAIYSNNDLDSNQSIERAMELIAVDPKNPRALSFEARDTKDGSVTVSLAGGQFKVPKATFNEMAQTRLERIRTAESQNATQAEKDTKRSNANAATKKVNDEREGMRGQPRPRGQVLRSKTFERAVLPVDNDAVDKRQAQIRPDAEKKAKANAEKENFPKRAGSLITQAGKTIVGVGKSAAKTYDEDFAKRK